MAYPYQRRGKEISSVNDYLRWAHGNSANTVDANRPPGLAFPAAVQFQSASPAILRDEPVDRDDYYSLLSRTSSKLSKRLVQNAKGDLQQNRPDMSSGKASQNPVLTSQSVPPSPERNNDAINQKVIPNKETQNRTKKASVMTLDPSVDAQIGDTVADLMKALNELIASNNYLLANKDLLSANSVGVKENEQQKKERKKLRKNIISLLQNVTEESSIGVKLLPRWKHRMIGNPRPLPTEVLAGKRLLRAIARAIIICIVRPKLAIYRRRAKVKDRRMADMSRKMQVFADACCMWLGKFVNVPFISVQYDFRVDFDLVNQVHSGGLLYSVFPCLPQPVNQILVKQRIIQLQVRVSAVVRNIIAGGLPPAHIIDFFVALTSDNTYFTPDYLWDIEKNRLEFDDLESIIHMVKASEDGSENGIDTSRIKMIIMNFLFLRVLVDQVCLSPWCKSLCPKPTIRVSKVVYNFRVLSSLLYVLLRKIDSNLPALADIAEVTVRKASQVAPLEISRKLSTKKTENTSLVQKIIARVLPDDDDAKDDKNPSDLAADVAESPSAIIEGELLQPRNWFPTLESLCSKLVPLCDLSPILQDSDSSWIDTLATQLSSWLDLLVDEVLIRRRRLEQAAKAKT